MIINEYGFPLYCRRSDNHITVINGVPSDNCLVIPHNYNLCVMNDCHINVGLTNLDICVKYLCKYICKGVDTFTITMENSHLGQHNTNKRDGNEHDEIKEYLDCWFVSASEVIWHIFGFYIHKH